MNAILVSVPPEVCERTANGEQALLLMKRIPKLDAPYKVYIYKTKKPVAVQFSGTGKHISEYDKTYCYHSDSGKVIGLFICRGIMHPNDSLKLMAKQSCMSETELDKSGKGKTPYGLRITDLTIFDKPKELGEFKRDCGQYGTDNPLCDGCKYFIDGRSYEYDESDCAVCGHIPLTRPPLT